jgi:ribose transport system substrate-binding protein
MGYLAVESLVAQLHGHRPQPKVFVDVGTLTQANMNDRSIRAVLAHYAQ